MSAKTEKKNRSRMSQTKIDDLLREMKGEQPVISIMAEPQPEVVYDTETNEEIQTIVKPTMHNNYEYDSMQPEAKLKEFAAYIRKCLAKYEQDQEDLKVCEQKIQDILHFMEMGDDQKYSAGSRLYKLLRDERRERRRCKNEIELLYPVYQLFHGTKILEQLSQTQGACRVVKQSIDERLYSARTDVLDDFMGGRNAES